MTEPSPPLAAPGTSEPPDQELARLRVEVADLAHDLKAAIARENTAPVPPQGRQPLEGEWQRVAGEYERRMDMATLRANRAEAASARLREGLAALERFHGYMLPDRDANGKPLGSYSVNAVIRASDLAALLAAGPPAPVPQEPQK